MSHKYHAALIIALVLLIGAGCGQSTKPAPASTSAFIEPPTLDTDQAPDFSLLTPYGDTVTLSDYRGQIVLINFWASWCTSCDAEMDALETYFQDHHEEGFTLIAVNYRESDADVAAYVEKKGLTFPVVLDSTGVVADMYAVTGIPTSFFVGRDGELLGYWPGAVLNHMLEQSLTPMLAEK